MCALLGNPLEEFFVLQSSWLTSYAQCRMVLDFFSISANSLMHNIFCTYLFDDNGQFCTIVSKELEAFLPTKSMKGVSTLIRILIFSSNAKSPKVLFLSANMLCEICSNKDFWYLPHSTVLFCTVVLAQSTLLLTSGQF